jgi:exosortase
MTTFGTLSALGERQERVGRALPVGVIAAGLFLVLAHLPLLAVHARQLWMRPHYQFLPFVVAGAAFLAFVRLRDFGPLQPGTRRRSYLLLAVSWGLLALAGLLFSPWLGAVSTLVTLAALAYALGGTALLRRLWPAWLFLWLIVPPPFELDAKLVSGLQTLTARCGSKVLDALGVFHVLAGHVVEVGARRFLVEEACSGSHSFFAVLPATLFLVLWLRRSLLQAALLVAAALVWVLVANVARVVGVTALATQAGLDLSGGWRHEVFGWLVFVVTVGLIVSTDCLILFFTSPVAPGPEPSRVLFRPAAPPTGGTPVPPPRSPLRLPDWRQTVLAGWPVPVAYGLLAVAQVGVFWLLFFGPSRSIPGLDAVGADFLPARWGPWQRGEYTRGWVGHYGAFFSHTWDYPAERYPAAVSLDYPFRGWHDLANCYVRIGWTVQEQAVHPPEAAEPSAPFLAELRLSKAPDQHAYLLYSLFDAQGRPVGPPGAPHTEGLLRSLLRRAPGGQSGLPSCQVQLLVQSSAPLTPDEQRQAREFFGAVWERLRSNCAGAQEGSR